MRSSFKDLLIPFLVLSFSCCSAQPSDNSKPVTDRYGVIVRGDTSKKTITIVFTGHEFADGGNVIRKTLRMKKVPGSFFFTGDFYLNPNFSSLIRQLKKDGHYLGAHSHHHLLYNDWEKRDSTLVTESEFKKDLQDNYDVMSKFGIRKEDAPYFLPPYEWYNADIAKWTIEMDLTLINFSSGTRSNADYTYPEMESRYVGTEEIYQSILNYEKRYGMNGFILLVHVGTDPRRTDKLYNRLGNLIDVLKAKGYSFARVDELLR
jgi:peptidoglycan/xylan/chitin deacetylase (PgdA/CDA1 family)